MFTGQIATISNHATWLSDLYTLIDETDSSTVDLSNPAYTVAISVYIKDMDGSVRTTHSLTDGGVVIVAPGFQWQFADTDLNSLSAGTYSCGVKITINGFITDLIVGTVAVIEGN